MHFLADECCDFAAVRFLRADGHDVLAVSEVQHRSLDKELMELALTKNRILLTEDKDFGWLVFVGRAATRLTIGGSLCSSAAGGGLYQFRTSAHSIERVMPKVDGCTRGLAGRHGHGRRKVAPRKLS